MKETVCSACGHENAAGVRYCQRCGAFLKPKHTLSDEVKSWNPQSLAGSGLKGTSIAPLYTLRTSDTVLSSDFLNAKISAPVDPLPDGRWYCPDCGTFNASAAAFCKNCGKVR